MKKDKRTDNTPADLKHDTMEFSAATDGDDRLDTDDETYEEEEISAEELEAIDYDENEAAALNAASKDRLTDDDVLPDEDWVTDTDPDDSEV